MRLFVAIDSSEAARIAIGEERNQIRRRLAESSATWVALEQMHVTLVFIGEVDEARAHVIAELVGSDVPLKPFRLVFGGVGVFPPHGSPKVLWIGTMDGTDQAIELQRRIVAQLEPAGVQPDTRPFHPHVTLARWKSRRSAQRGQLVTAPAAALTEVEVDAVTLYHSRLSSVGPTYTALSRGRLSCR